MTEPGPARTPRDTGRALCPLCYLLDGLVVVAFAAAGRSSHDEGLSPAGIADTAWPFLAALVAGWLLVALWGRPPTSFRAWGVLWPVTVAGGMLLRWLTGDGTALPFVLVATTVLGAGLLAVRVVLSAVVRARSRR